MFALLAKTTPFAASSDGTFSVEWLKGPGVRIAVILAVAAVVSWLGRAAVKRVRRRLESSGGQTAEQNLRRTATITGTLTGFILVAVWTVALLLVLGELEVNLAPLLASAGIAGVALSFGAQSLVRDFLVGFFVIFENQYSVGDTVAVTVGGGSFEGKIEDLTLRYTSVRAPDGTLYEVGNGNILFVANKSRGTGRITIDVLVPKAGSLHDMERRLDDVVLDMREDAAIHKVLSAGPNAEGVAPSDNDRVQVTITAEIWASRHDQAEAMLRRELTRRLSMLSEREADGT